MNSFEKLKIKLSELSDLSYSIGLMHWDQEVNLAKGSFGRRASQISTLSGMAHEIQNGQIPDLLKAAEDQNDRKDPVTNANLRELRRDIEKSLKLPKEFIIESSNTIAQSHPIWVESKKKDDFSIFSSQLEKIIEINKRKAEYYGYENDPYDALLDVYEPGLSAQSLTKLFNEFELKAKPIYQKVLEGAKIDNSPIMQVVTSDTQLAFGKSIVENLGYNLERGRIDLSAHPFTIGLGPEDVRITTAVDLNDPTQMLYSSIHEAGHGIYEQGLLPEYYGLPTGSACSLGVHESQSRFYENNLCRSEAFIEWMFPAFRKMYPQQLDGSSHRDLFKMINKIKPGLIRIYADELTYHFHIMVRFQIEKMIMNSEVKTADIPAIWNEKIEKYLGLKVDKVSNGCLQDIHWSHGSFGYFPTYSIGSFLAAMISKKMENELGNMWDSVRSGSFSDIKNWLNNNIHQHGRRYSPEELSIEACGQPLSVDPFIDYISKKVENIYG